MRCRFTSDSSTPCSIARITKLTKRLWVFCERYGS
jgi:hypothetical protein